MTDNEPKGWEKAAVMEMRRRFPIIFKVANVSVDLGASADISVVQTAETTDEDLLEYIRENFIPKAEVRKVVDASVKTPTLCGNCDLNGKLCKECYANRRANSALSEVLRALHISDE